MFAESNNNYHNDITEFTFILFYFGVELHVWNSFLFFMPTRAQTWSEFNRFIIIIIHWIDSAQLNTFFLRVEISFFFFGST